MKKQKLKRNECALIVGGHDVDASLDLGRLLQVRGIPQNPTSPPYDLQQPVLRQVQLVVTYGYFLPQILADLKGISFVRYRYNKILE